MKRDSRGRFTHELTQDTIAKALRSKCNACAHTFEPKKSEPDSITLEWKQSWDYIQSLPDKCATCVHPYTAKQATPEHVAGERCDAPVIEYDKHYIPADNDHYEFTGEKGANDPDNPVWHLYNGRIFHGYCMSGSHWILRPVLKKPVPKFKVGDNVWWDGQWNVGHEEKGEYGAVKDIHYYDDGSIFYRVNTKTFTPGLWCPESSLSPDTRGNPQITPTVNVDVIVFISDPRIGVTVPCSGHTHTFEPKPAPKFKVGDTAWWDGTNGKGIRIASAMEVIIIEIHPHHDDEYLPVRLNNRCYVHWDSLSQHRPQFRPGKWIVHEVGGLLPYDSGSMDSRYCRLARLSDFSKTVNSVEVLMQWGNADTVILHIGDSAFFPVLNIDHGKNLATALGVQIAPAGLTDEEKP